MNIAKQKVLHYCFTRWIYLSPGDALFLSGNTWNSSDLLGAGTIRIDDIRRGLNTGESSNAIGARPKHFSGFPCPFGGNTWTNDRSPVPGTAKSGTEKSDHNKAIAVPFTTRFGFAAKQATAQYSAGSLFSDQLSRNAWANDRNVTSGTAKPGTGSSR